MSDEQRIREQFGKWIEERQYGLGWQDGRGTWEEFLRATGAGFHAGYRSRDAEVQALREALREVVATTEQVSVFKLAAVGLYGPDFQAGIKVEEEGEAE